MKLTDAQRYALLNVLNVLVRISDVHFVSECWTDEIVCKKRNEELKDIDFCNTIVFSCREALNILEDYQLYDLLEDDYGFWGQYIGQISFDTIFSLKDAIKDVLLFVDNECIDTNGPELLKNERWMKIMKKSKIAALNLRNDLGVQDSDFLY